LLLFLLGLYLIGYGPHALFCILAPLSTTEIDLGIDDLVAALALSLDLVFEELRHFPAFRALGGKDIAWLPISPILTRTFHSSSSLIFNLKYTVKVFIDLGQKL
jgi:hypothetical protein